MDTTISCLFKKTKIVTFSNSGRKCKHLFQYDDSVIENVSNYNYLGIKFNSSGTFTYAQKELVITNCNTTISCTAPLVLVLGEQTYAKLYAYVHIIIYQLCLKIEMWFTSDHRHNRVCTLYMLHIHVA
jgi:hypothetical protein